MMFTRRITLLFLTNILTRNSQKESVKPILNSQRKTESDKGEIMMNWLGGVCFKLRFGKDKSNWRDVVEKAMSGEYKYSNSKIQLDNKKIILLFCVDIPE